jgi:hypothetical protein
VSPAIARGPTFCPAPHVSGPNRLVELARRAGVDPWLYRCYLWDAIAAAEEERAKLAEPARVLSPRLPL